MSITGLNYYEQHFLLSNRIIRYVGGLNTNIKLNDQVIRNFLLAVFAFPPIFYQLYQVYDIKMDWQTSCYLLQTMLGTLGVLCSYGAANLQINTTHHLVAHIKYDYEHYLDENEFSILKKYTKFTKIYTIILVGSASIYYICITTPSFLNICLHIFGLVENVNLTLPIPVNNISNRGFIYYSLLVYQIVAMTCFITIGCVIYLLYLQFIQHACTQFSILILKIRQPFAEQKFIRIKWDSHKNQEDLKWIINIIKSYTRVTEFINLINRLSKMIYLIGIFFSIIVIFFDIIYILELPIILKSNTKKMLECLITIFGTLFLIYINFFFGQMLIDHSKEAFEELCQVPYYMLSKKTQKLLLLFTARSIQPCKLSIGGVFSASHEIFAGVMQKSFGFATAYYSLLQ